MDDSGKMFAAFLLGIIAGGAAGLLLAPKTGREARENVERYVKDVEGKFNQKKEEFKKRYRKDSAPDAAQGENAGY
ncbi:MAG: YtxH domain-containing protein [Spirochaetota bacterium]|jgi:gas vesicle protein|nr:YtxH domain-containing protein [Spirochaetota bacterium]